MLRKHIKWIVNFEIVYELCPNANVFTEQIRSGEE